MPDSLPVISVPAIRLSAAADLFQLIRRITPVNAREPLAFEDLDQSDGYILYRHRFGSAASGTLEVPGLRDYAAVMVDGKRVATLSRRDKVFSASIDVPAGGTLDILVENMGRINYGAELVDNRKGIIQPVTLGAVKLRGWSMYRLPFERPPSLSVKWESASAQAGIPTVYHGAFALERVGDTFLDMRGWNKGIVFVNGINLGRYWKVGPQQTLYVPGAWLHRGTNDIVVFEMNGHSTGAVLTGIRTPILTQLDSL